MKKCVFGVPKETKDQEGRVGMTPWGVRVLCALGCMVIVQNGAGVLSGHTDEDYAAAGASLCDNVEALYRAADIIVKVKELTPTEYYLIPLLRGKILFTYLHLAGVDPELTKLLLQHEVTAIAYETVMQMVDGRMTFPLLIPMSKIAGREAVRAALLRLPKEMRAWATVVIIGCGVVGEGGLIEAMKTGVGRICIFEISPERRKELHPLCASRPEVYLYPLELLYEPRGVKVLGEADIVLLGVMCPGGAEATKVLSEDLLLLMKEGAYIADVPIDQGGATAWSRVTKPGETFIRGKNKLVFSCTPNIPGSTVPVEATPALTEATLPYIEAIAKSVLSHGLWSGSYYALRDHQDLRQGLQTFRGFLVNKGVSSKHRIFDAYQPLDHFF